MSAERTPVGPEDCPEPFWHETHRYCPCCTWTEPQAPVVADPLPCPGVCVRWFAAVEHACQYKPGHLAVHRCPCGATLKVQSGGTS